MAVGPVCGMSVDRGSAPAQVMYDGRIFFCAQGCRDEFLASPEKFLLSVPILEPLLNLGNFSLLSGNDLPG